MPVESGHPPDPEGYQGPSGTRTASTFVPFTGAEIVTLQAGALPTKASRKFAPDKDAALVANLWTFPTQEIIRLDPTVNVAGICHSVYPPSANQAPGYPAISVTQYSAGFPWPDANLEAWARAHARNAADLMHYCGRILGYGAKNNGAYGGPLLDRGFGVYSGLPAGDSSAIMAHPGDTLNIAGLPEVEVTKRVAQYPNLVRDGSGQLEANPIPWAQATLFGEKGIENGYKYQTWFWDELVIQCANYTRHGGAAVQLYLPETVMFDQESPVSVFTIHAVQFIPNTTGSYDPGSDFNPRVVEGFSNIPVPNVRGIAIPGYIRMADISRYLQAKKVTDSGGALPRGEVEAILQVKNSQGQLENWTFLQWWNSIIAEGIYDGVVPLPGTVGLGSGSLTQFGYACRALVEENLQYRLKFSAVKAANEKIGRAVKWNNYVQFKYNPAVTGNPILGFARIKHYLASSNAPTLYFAQYRGQTCASVSESFRNAGLDVTRTRLQICDPALPTTPWLPCPQANGATDFLYGDEDFVAQQVLLAWYEFDCCEFNFWLVDGTYEDAAGWQGPFKRMWEYVYSQFRLGHQDRSSGLVRSPRQPRVTFKGRVMTIVLEPEDADELESGS